MLHVDPERLAALADEEPTAEERAHLAGCPPCAAEVAAYRELLAHAGAACTSIVAAPLTDWDTLSARLAGEGLLRRAGNDGAARRGGFRARGWMRVAAAVMLVAGGAAFGRATAAVPLGSRSAAPARSDAQRIAPAPTKGGGSESLASASQDSAGAFVSLQDALDMMRRADRDYRLAAAYVALHDTSSRSADVFRTRLAALDRVQDAALEAVNEAPSDPVINQYLLSARTAREVTLQQLKNSLPSGVRLASY